MQRAGSTLDMLALAGGRLAGAVAMAPPRTREVAALRQVSAIWEAYLCDAGPGDVGRDHIGSPGGLLVTSDPRRDGVLLWLVNNATPEFAVAAATAAKAVGAKRSLGSVALGVLAAAIDMLPAPPVDGQPAVIEQWLWTYAERLRAEAAFTESTGEAFEIITAEGRIPGYRGADAGACWAANLALQARARAMTVPLPPGTFSRNLFRLDLDAKARAIALQSQWQRGLDRAQADLFEVDRELKRGALALSGLSKNSRAGDAWSMVIGLGDLTRTHLARALGLSRGGAGLIVQQLADANLVRLNGTGKIVRADPEAGSLRPLDSGLRQATTAVDQAMAEIDRLLGANVHR
jgi:hypothetical protein